MNLANVFPCHILNSHSRSFEAIVSTTTILVFCSDERDADSTTASKENLRENMEEAAGDNEEDLQTAEGELLASSDSIEDGTGEKALIGEDSTEAEENEVAEVFESEKDKETEKVSKDNEIEEQENVQFDLKKETSEKSSEVVPDTLGLLTNEASGALLMTTAGAVAGALNADTELVVENSEKVASDTLNADDEPEEDSEEVASDTVVANASVEDSEKSASEEAMEEPEQLSEGVVEGETESHKEHVMEGSEKTEALTFEAKKLEEDDIEREILDDDAAISTLESPPAEEEEEEKEGVEDEKEEKEVGDVEEKQKEKEVEEDKEHAILANEEVFVDESEKENADFEISTENPKSKTSLESVTRLGTGSRIAHAMANVDNVENDDNPDDKVDNQEELENTGDVNGKEEQAISRDTTSIDEDKANGNVLGRAAESNARNDDIERTLKAGISKNDLKPSIKDEVFTTTGQSGLESANTSVNGIGSSLTKGNPLNGLDTNGNGVVAGLKSELHNGGNSIKTLVESPVKKLLDPATAG